MFKELDPRPRGVPLDRLYELLSSTTLKLSRQEESLIGEHEATVSTLKVIEPTEAK
jgi:hypothetical protein